MSPATPRPVRLAIWTRPRTLAWTLLLAGLWPAAVARGDEAENAGRLRAMPRERREALLKNLDAFDALDRDEQAALRRLDEQLAACAPADRERYLAVAHRYHLWLQTLTEEQRRALRAAPAEERTALVARYRAEQRKGEPVPRPGDWLQVSTLSPMNLEESARQLAIWFELDPQARRQVAQVKGKEERLQRLQELARSQHAGFRAQRIRREFLAEAQTALRDLQGQAKRLESLKGAAVAKNLAKAAPKADRLHRLVEYRYLRGHRPAPVAAEDLALFEASMAPWVRESLDLLPPEATRLRLQVLYRLVFPPGEEIPRPKPKEAGAKAAPAPKQGPPRPGAPF